MSDLMQSGVGWYGRRRSYHRRTLTSKPQPVKPATGKQEQTR